MPAVTTQQVKLKIRALKTTLLVDTQVQVVLDVHVTTTHKHETQVAPKTERNLERFEALVADKGYDDQTCPNPLRFRKSDHSSSIGSLRPIKSW
jgi:IS5 family transposase